MVELSNKRDLFDFARQLHTWGANVTAIQFGSKRPAHKWRHWQQARQTSSELTGLPWGRAAAVGVVDDYAGWHNFDFDDCPSFDPVSLVLAELHLPATYPWVIRTGSGWRVSVRCLDDLPAAILTTKTGTGGGLGVFTFAPKRIGDFDHLELRWRKCQTILAGQHPSGRAYSFAHDLPIHPPTAVLLGRVLQATLAVGKLPQHKTQPQEQSTTHHKLLNTSGLGTSDPPLRDAQSRSRPGRSAAWAAAVLFGELDALSQAQAGQRNITLNRTAFALGRLVGAHLLDRADVETQLETTALSLGLDPIEIRYTIKSGLDVGEAQPRNAPCFARKTR